MSLNNDIVLKDNIKSSIWSMLFTVDGTKFLIIRDGILCDKSFTAEEIVKDISFRNIFSSDDLMIIYFQLVQDYNRDSI